jgi:heme/copper-type cytochrome/quinol oxidase subunit 2
MSTTESLLPHSTDVTVRRRWSFFSIIGALVVAIVLAILAYYAYLGWRSRGAPMPEVQKTATPTFILPTAAVPLG